MENQSIISILDEEENSKKDLIEENGDIEVNIDSINEINDKEEDESLNPNKKQRKKRRTKDEVEGRNHTCLICQRSYLSYQALTNHTKSKHNPNELIDVKIKTEKKSRGRPKKLFQSTLFLSQYEDKIKNFFELDKRKINKEEQSIDINSILSEIKTKILNQIYTEENKPTNHPILNSLYINEETETDNNSNKNRMIDEIFVEFLKNSLSKTNVVYLEKIILYCCLFRESINKIKNNDNYTGTESGEIIPNMANDYIIYMTDPDKNYPNEDEDKIDIVEYVQYFCYWCHTNGFTNSRLFLNLK